LANQNLMTDRPLAKRFGEALRERVLAKFPLSRVLKDTISLYTKN